MDLKKYVVIVLTILHNVISRSVRKRSCTTTTECGDGKICKKNICRRMRQNEATNPLLVKEKFCTDQSSCPIGYYCDVKLTKCQRMVKSIHVMYKQPECRSVFKKFCLSDSHCSCSQKKMVCEDNECVVRKRNKPVEKVCRNLVGDCAPGYICDCGKMRCRHIKDLMELKRIFRRFTSTSQCRASEVCDGGVCKCSSKPQKNVASLCEGDTDCGLGYKCNNRRCTQSIQHLHNNDV